MNKKIITATLLISDGPVEHSYFSELLDITNDELINIFLKHYNSYNFFCSAIVKNKSYINIEIIKCN